MNTRLSSAAWRVGFPSPPDLNFDFSRLLNDTQHTGVAKNIRPGLRVAIIGAGIAGLTAAHELFRCGVTHLDLYEASDRIGGRLRSQPVDGQRTVFELGAMRIPMFTQYDGSSAAVFAHYAKGFGLTSQPFPMPSNTDVSFGAYSDYTSSTQLKPRGGVLPIVAEVEFVRQKWNTFASRFLTMVRSRFDTPLWPSFWYAIEQRYWRHSLRTVMLAPLSSAENNLPADIGGAGMNEQEICILERAGIGEGPWTAYLDLSAMFVFRLLLFGYFDDVRLIQGRFDAAGDYAGGPHAGDTSLTDSLGHSLSAPVYLGVQSIAETLLFCKVQSVHVAPISLYEALRDDRYCVRLFTRTPVESIARASGELRIASRTSQRSYDAVLLTTPMFGDRCAIRTIDFADDELPHDVISGDRMSHWLASSKVYVALKKRYWEKTPIPQVIATDGFLESTYAYALQTPRISDPGVLLLSYTWDALSNNLLNEADDDALVSRCIATLDQMLKLSGMRGKISDYVDMRQSAVIHWYKQPTIRGAGRVYRAGIGQPNRALLAYNQRYSAKSQLYLAGEAYTLDGCWVESAMRMALDAVLHLLQHHHAEFAGQFNFDKQYPTRITENVTK
jgi:tryptophan 2-monooxygenase